MTEQEPKEKEQDIVNCQNCRRITAVINDCHCADCGEMVCLACGCTYYTACPGGCYWVRRGMCSACD